MAAAVRPPTLALALPREASPRSPMRRTVWHLVRAKPAGAAGLAIIVVTALIATLAGILAPADPDVTFRGYLLQPPSAYFLLGTDQLGRDVLSRLIYGARVSLLVGFFSVALGVIGGGLLGMLSGYRGGRVDLWLQRAMDVAMALPAIVLALAILAVMGPGLTNVILAIAIPQIPRVNRIVRASVLSEKQQPYVDAARVAGCSSLRIAWRHLTPNVLAPVLVLATLNFSTAIVQEASLSFLGVGTPANIPSWGLMLSGEARKFMLVQPWLAVWPGVAIMISVLAWNFLGDALRDILDPRLRVQG
jgi:peptide/nickel transport system permease protein